MATIVEMINPLTGLPEQVDQLDHTAQEIDDAVGLAPQLSNPNLLDNWYFGNPVNQRGQTEYTGAGYGIDRWRLTGGGTVAVVDDGLTLTSPPQWNGLWQYGENFANFKGTKLTLSFLVKSIENPGEFYATIRVSDTLVKSVTINNAGLATATLDVTEEPTMLRVALCANVANAGSITVFAAKLELGSQQTLAHQENGVWVLNEIPDYGEQLRRCQRYSVHGVGPRCSGYAINGSDMATIFIPTPVTMRTIASAEIVTTDNLVTSYGDVIPIKSFSPAVTLPNGVVGNLQINSPVTQNCVVAASGFKCNLIADL